MSTLTAELQDAFNRLCGRLSPENLHCDGEISRAEAGRRYRQIMQEWKVLEKQAGRSVSQHEVEMVNIQAFKERNRKPV